MLGHQNALRLVDHRPRLQRVLELCGSSNRVLVAADRGQGDAREAGKGSRDAAAVVAERLTGGGVEVERADGAAGGRKSDGERVADAESMRESTEVGVGTVGVGHGDLDGTAGDSGIKAGAVAVLVLPFVEGVGEVTAEGRGP